MNKEAIAAFDKAERLWRKVNALIAEEMLKWGDNTEAITAHIAFLGMLEAQTTNSLETCPMPAEMKNMLRFAAASDFKDLMDDYKKGAGRG